MDFGQQRLDQIQQQIRQLQGIMNGQAQGAPQTEPAPPKQTTTILEVDGLEGARIFLKSMAPNSSAAVFDKHDQVFYGLAVDANGVPAPVQRCPYTMEVVPEPGTDVITKADFEGFKAEIRAAIAAMTRKEETE